MIASINLAFDWQNRRFFPLAAPSGCCMPGRTDWAPENQAVENEAIR